MMKELESAVLTRDLPEHGLVKGDVGTIVTVYAGQKAFKVEFITQAVVPMWAICVVASLYPAIRAARLDPARAMTSV